MVSVGMESEEAKGNKRAGYQGNKGREGKKEEVGRGKKEDKDSEETMKAVKEKIGFKESER